MASNIRHYYLTMQHSVVNAVLLLLAISVLLLLPALHVCADSNWNEWDGKEYRELRGILGALPLSRLGFPSDLHTSKDMYVFITEGAAYTKILVLTLSIGEEKLTSTLSKAEKDAGLIPTVQMCGIFKYYYLADITVARPRYGGRSSSNSIHLGRLVRSLRMQGVTPHVLLRIPNYMQDPHLNLPKRERLRYIWYNATESPVALNVPVHANVSFGLILLIDYIRFFLPAIGVIGFIAGLFAALNRRLPVVKRMAYFDWIGLVLPFAAGIMCGTSALVFHNSEFARMIDDVWFAAPTVDIEFIDILVSCAVLIFGVTLSGLLLRQKIFKGLDEEPDVIDHEVLLERIRKRTRAVGLASAILLLYIITMRPFQLDLWGVFQNGGCVVAFFANLLVIPAVSGIMLHPSKIDPELTSRAKELALIFCVDLREVKVAKGTYAQKNPNAFAMIRKKVICVTQKAVEVLTDREMDWLLAHELAHFKSGNAYKKALRLLGSIQLLDGLILMSVIIFNAYTRSLISIWLMGFIPVIVFIGLNEIMDVRRRLEYESDYQGMLVVRDLEVAVSALTAISMYSQDPRIHDQELDEHPKLIKRIKALRQAAEQLGITKSCKEETQGL